jgi:hypothetical protein
MTYLLDTQRFLGLLSEPEKLPAHVRAILADPATLLALSIVMPGEMAAKTGIGFMQPRFWITRTPSPHPADRRFWKQRPDRWCVAGGFSSPSRPV